MTLLTKVSIFSFQFSLTVKFFLISMRVQKSPFSSRDLHRNHRFHSEICTEITISIQRFAQKSPFHPEICKESTDGILWNPLESHKYTQGRTQEAPRKNPGGTQETPRRHPGGTQEAPRRHQETPRRQPGDQRSIWSKIYQII